MKPIYVRYNNKPVHSMNISNSLYYLFIKFADWFNKKSGASA